MKLRRKKRKFTLLLFLIIFSVSSLYGQEAKRSEDLYYTYLGPVLGFDYHWIEHKDWFETQRETRSLTGTAFSGGVCFAVFVDQFIGDFKVLFQYNNNSDEAIYHLTYRASGLYSWQMSEKVILATGLGIYLESSPSNVKYENGAGFFLPGTFYFDATYDVRLMTEIFLSYGTYGRGEESTKLATGINLGVIFKVGRM